MKERIISGAIALIILLTVVLLGGVFVDAAILILSLIGIYEMRNALRNIDIEINVWLCGLFSISTFIIAMTQSYSLRYEILSIFVVLNALLFVFKQNYKMHDMLASIFVMYYVVFFMYHIAFMKGTLFVWFIFITAWASDTAAYFTGRFFGKHKLCPNLSPKKTIEGSIGGILGSVIACLAFSVVFNITDLKFILTVAIFGSIFGQIGDLVASKIKRTTQIKDYGKIMPGHGGVVDRFDSILLTAPLTYFLFTLFIA